MMSEDRYFAAKTVDDVWICYPWEAMYVKILDLFPSSPTSPLSLLYFIHSPTCRSQNRPLRKKLTSLLTPTHINSDIDEHDRLAAEQPQYWTDPKPATHGKGKNTQFKPKRMQNNPSRGRLVSIGPDRNRSQHMKSRWCGSGVNLYMEMNSYFTYSFRKGTKRGELEREPERERERGRGGRMSER